MNRKEGTQSFHQLTFDIYVGNVSKNINEADLKVLFGKYGEVKQVLCRRKDDYIGYAIVKFVYKLDAERVLHSTDEVVWNGHHMPVKAARRSDQSQSNGNGANDIKPHSYPESNINLPHPGSHFSNTDFGYFHPPMYNEDHLMYSQPAMLEVYCTNVEDGITFNGYQCNRYNELECLSKSLRQLNLQPNRIDRKPIAKKVYAALFSGDNDWYRCSIIQSTIPNKPGMCLVRYIDYGNKEEICYRNIVELPESLQKLPPFSAKFILSNLVCEVKQPNKKTYLHQLVNKRMTLCAYLLNGNHEYQVIKCSCNGKDVISETINKGFAKPKRSMSAKPYTQQEFISKPKAYSCGTEIRLKPDSPVHILKPSETTSTNQNNNKILQKNPIKNNTVSPKMDNVHCNGTVNEDTRKEDFHPTRIIKRGSELSDIMKCNGAVNPPKETVSRMSTQMSTIDTVIPNLKLINNIRSLVSQSSDDSIINCAVDLLKEEISTIELTENSKKCVGDAYNDYSEALNKIKKCSDKTLFPSLKLERDLCRSTLCVKLKDYLGSCDSSIFERKEKIQKTIIDLASNSNAWMNVQLDKKPNSLDELISEYTKVKDERWKLVSETRQNTNQKHKEFMDVFTCIQKELYLNTLEENDALDSIQNDSNGGKTPSYSEKLIETLKELGKALDKEIQMLTLNKERKAISVIQCLLDILDIHKEKVESVCELYENRYAMYNELSKVPDIEKTMNELATVEEEVHNLCTQLSKYRNSANETAENVELPSENTESSPEMTDLVKDLHRTILKEDYLKAVLAKAADSYFPELNAEHQELRLYDHSRNKFLLKNWKLDYFFNLKLDDRRNSSYSTQLLDEPITLKEYSFENAENANMFIKKAVLWNEIKSDSLVKVKALFSMNENKIYVILPPVSSTLLERSSIPSPFEAEKSCRMLRAVLAGLRDMHSQGLVHRYLHPLTVAVEGDKAMMDFCFDSKYLDGKSNLKGINFVPPEDTRMHESSDMYSFGCLVLWVLFPNLMFTSSVDGVPNVSAFRSIIEELILPKDYAMLSALVDANPERRPSSSLLLTKGFLSKYEAYCRSQCDAQKA